MNGRPRILVVVDMQVDFLTGALKNLDAARKVPYIAGEIRTGNYDRIFLTKDGHDDSYLSTNEGRHLPVPHCLYGTPGYMIAPAIVDAAYETVPNGVSIIPKNSFGSQLLADSIVAKNPRSVTFVGTCTDICVVSNVILTKTKLAEAGFQDVDVYVIPELCSGTSKEAHDAAIAVMASCQAVMAKPSYDGGAD